MQRRRGGYMRFLPADVLGWPLAAVGLALLLDVRASANRVADGTTTVRVLVANPRGALGEATGWLGLVLLAGGIALAFAATRRRDPHRWGMGVRYPPFGFVARVLALATALAMWDLFGHVVDVAPGGLVWRFLAVERRGWLNLATVVLLAVGALACYGLSFGRLRLSDFAAYAARQRVATSSTATAVPKSGGAKGVASQGRSARGRDDSGSPAEP